MKNTDIADTLKKRVASYYKKKRRVCFFELGLCRRGRLRADVFVLAMNGHAVVVEVKSSVADFRAGAYKYESYREYCDQFYFAMNASLYEKIREEIPKGAGVFIFDDIKLKILPCRKREINEEVRRGLFIRAAFRNSDTSNRKNKRA